MTFQKETTFNIKFFIGLLSLVSLGASIYLTQHFYQVHFPAGIGEGGICNLSSFLNCDSATNSPISNVFGAPISSFGIITSIIFIAPFLLTTINFSGIILVFGSINLIGCLALLLYSLIALGTLCPVCSIFWISSNLAFYLSYKNLSDKIIKPVPTISFGALFLITTLIGHLTYTSKEKDILLIKDDLIAQYKGLDLINIPDDLPSLDLIKSTESFSEAPIQLIIFSDFQCPACKALSKMVDPIMKRYKGKINIKYLFYPLDNSCNSKMSYPLHDQACNAAKISLCKKEELLRVHDEIFEHQSDIDDEWIQEKIKDENVAECYSNKETMEKLISVVDIGNEIGVKSTPTFLLNNKKIEGVLPLRQLYILMDSLL